ncbi:MBL fold metallo-hydrolase [Emticicia sp.]|uniref:MBL fold metallo-hydrolase n=1 Tax=Emticicia sp. TaxID=1930953 RepID=UPI003BAD1A9D
MISWILVISVVLVIIVWGFMQQAVFGKDPESVRLERIKKSANYKEGVFQNLSPTSVMSESGSYWQMIKEYFNKPADVIPQKEIPSIQTNLKALVAPKPTIVWFGHSSYLIKSKETTILIDPVFSGSASPISAFVKAFNGANAYQTEDMPEIDMLFLSHDHYDHLDYQTIIKIAPKVKKFFVSLGVGAHLELWGIESEKIEEFAWWEEKKISADIEVITTPARHFSGRGFARGKSLWSSFVLKIHGYKLFLGGDSGYDTHFKTIGEKYGPFDIAMLENGQYNLLWHQIHTLPEETYLAAKDLKTKVLMPVHWAKFPLANHSWNEPIKRLKAAAAKDADLQLTTPMIGEPVVLDSLYPAKVWWEF